VKDKNVNSKCTHRQMAWLTKDRMKETVNGKFYKAVITDWSLGFKRINFSHSVTWVLKIDQNQEKDNVSL
jgi:hypothetical protein